MFIPTTYITLLKGILDQLHDEVQMEKEELVALYFFLFAKNTEQPTTADKELSQSIEFLKEIIDKEEFISIEELISYFDRQKAKVKKSMFDEMEKWDEATSKRTNGDFDLIRGSNYSYVRKIRNLFYDFSNEIAIGPIFGHAMQGSYTKASWLYLREFSSMKRTKKVFIMYAESRREIEMWDVKDVYIKFVGHFSTGKSTYINAILDVLMRTSEFSYKNLLERISTEQRLTGDAIKLQLTSLFFMTKQSLWETSTNLCLWDEGRHLFDDEDQDDKRTPTEIFEHWVHFAFENSFADKKWVILKSPKELSWLTSDDPGVFVGGEPMEKLCVQLKSCCMINYQFDKLYYPLSKDYCLRIEAPSSKRKKGSIANIDFEESSEEELNQVNELTVSNKHTMVIASDKKMLERYQQI